MKLVPNFHFQGQCEQAIELYRMAFGAEVSVLLRYADAKAEDGVYGPDVARLIYHAELTIDGQRLVMSDETDKVAPGGHRLSLMVSFASAEKARAAYERLSEGGTPIASPTETSYSGFFASLIDRYGARWELIYER